MIERVVVCGENLYHPDSYINYGFYNAFIELGYDTYWIHERNLDKMNSSMDTNTLYIVNDTKNNHVIPVNKSNYYVIIKSDPLRFRSIDKHRVHLLEYSTTLDLNSYTKLEDYIYEYRRKRIIVMPYASMLTPNQIIENLNNYVEKDDRENTVVLTRHYDNNIQNEIINTNSTRLNIKKLITLDNEVDLIRKIRFSCCYASDQTKIDYKTITHCSYGTMCITNSLLTHDFFKSKLCYLADTSTLDSTIDSFYSSIKKEDIFDLIEFIINNHTFINRIQTIFTYFGI